MDGKSQVLTEVETLLSGVLGKTESATQSILLRYSTFIYIVLGGFSAICITRIGEKIGQKSAQNTKTASLAAIILHLGLGIIIAVALTALGCVKSPLCKYGMRYRLLLASLDN